MVPLVLPLDKHQDELVKETVEIAKFIIQAYLSRHLITLTTTKLADR